MAKGAEGNFILILDLSYTLSDRGPTEKERMANIVIYGVALMAEYIQADRDDFSLVDDFLSLSMPLTYLIVHQCLLRFKFSGSSQHRGIDVRIWISHP